MRLNFHVKNIIGLFDPNVWKLWADKFGIKINTNFLMDGALQRRERVHFQCYSDLAGQAVSRGGIESGKVGCNSQGDC